VWLPNAGFGLNPAFRHDAHGDLADESGPVHERLEGAIAMPCRATDVIVRRVAGLVLGAAVLTIASPLTPWGGGSTAWSDTQRISDGAVATAPDRVPVGGKITVEGQNWTAPSGAGSVIAVKLDDGNPDRRTPVMNPATGDPISDSSVVAAVRASSDGTFTIALPVPEDEAWTAGSRHTIRLLSGRLLSDDATRSVALTFDLVSESDQASEASAAASPSPSPPETHTAGPTPAVPSRTPPAAPDTNASAGSGPAPGPSAESSAHLAPNSRRGSGTGERSGAASQEPLATDGARGPAGLSASTAAASCRDEPTVTLTSKSSIRGVPVADLGGVLGLAGSGFCQRRGGGSLIAVKIDDGEVRRLDDTVSTDRTIWQIIRAEDDGTFRVDVRLPDLRETDPDFADGSHRLRLQTGLLSGGDPVRSVRTGEFVVVPGNNAGTLPEPAGTPSPVDPVRALVRERGGAVTAAQSGGAVRVVVPGAQPGDWLFAYTFRGTASQSSEASPTTWLQVDANRSVTFDPAGFANAAAGGSRISLQARDGTLVGWAQITTDSVAAAPADPGPPRADSPDRSDPRPPTGPRSLVVFSAGGLLLLGLVALVMARDQRRRVLRQLNGE
jgi:hypothetical protein